VARRSVLERIVEERVGQTFVVSVSAAVDRLAKKIAREALSDRAFRRSIRELVRRRSEELLDRIFENGSRQGRRRAPSTPRRSLSKRARDK
jgi:hypothetical protein